MRGRFQHALALVFFCSLTFSSICSAAVSASGRHMYLLRAGLGQVVGTYFFAVNNDGDAPERLKFQLLLPKEMIDFAPAEGIDPKNISLGPEGGVLLDQEFKPGFNLVGVYFIVPSPSADGKFTLNFPNDIQELRIMSQSEELGISSEGFKPFDATSEDPSMKFGIASTQPLKSGSQITVHFTGVPEGRSWFWIAGSVTAGLLVGISILMFYRTKESLEGKEVMG